MTKLTVEEMNLLSIYKADGKWELLGKLGSALPFMEDEMRTFAEHTMKKIDALSEEEFAALSFYPADEAE